MPYPAGHRDRVRSRIVESARRLFNRSGFDGVSVNAIMADAGLTRGGFYTYFASKSDLYAEALGCFFTDPNWKSRWEGVEIDLASSDAGQQIVKAYLSRQHLENIEDCCPMVALPSDVARSGAKVKGAFETIFRAMVRTIGRDVRTNGKPRDQIALAIAALCVGGMVVARSVADRALADRICDAAAGVALDLGGWAMPLAAPAPRSSRRTRRNSKAHTPSPRRAPHSE